MLNLTGELSLAAWFKTAAPVGNYRTLVSKWHTAPTDGAYLLGWENSAGLRFCVSNGMRMVCASSGQPYNDGQWHHVAGVWSGTTAVVSLINNFVSGSRALEGSALYLEGGSVDAGHSTVADNQSLTRVGNIVRVEQAATLGMTHTIFSGNTILAPGGNPHPDAAIIRVDAPASVVLQHTLWYSNSHIATAGAGTVISATVFGQMAGAPITSLADVIAINNEDPANRAPYGQSFLEWSVADELTPEEFARMQATAAKLGETWMRTLLEQNDVDILVTGLLYSGNAGAAGVPALTIPNGLDANGRPQGIILSGPYLSDPQRIAVGYALEQALNGRVEPDLDATIAQIDAMTGK